jgi:hypothetical protein
MCHVILEYNLRYMLYKPVVSVYCTRVSMLAGTRGVVAGMRPEAHYCHTANHRVCQDGTWLHEIVTG